MANYLSNAFSLQMLTTFPTTLNISECSKEEALSSSNISVVGHPDTAAVLGVKFILSYNQATHCMSLNFKEDVYLRDVQHFLQVSHLNILK